MKIPQKLMWGMLCKIAGDLDTVSLYDSFFRDSDFSSSFNFYDLSYVLLLNYLDKTRPLFRGNKYGESYSILGMQTNKTLIKGLLSRNKVWGNVKSLNWLCPIHSFFMNVVYFCRLNLSNEFIKSLVYIKLNDVFIFNMLGRPEKHVFERVKNDADLFFKVSITSDLSKMSCNILDKYYDRDSECLKCSALKQNESVYLSLCKLSVMIVDLNNKDSGESDSSILNFSKLEWYLVQQYGVRQVWDEINKHTELNGKKHHNFQAVIYNVDNAPSQRPDAIYLFNSDCKVKDIILDCKLYGKECVSGNYHTGKHYYCISHLVNQMMSYSDNFIKYLSSTKVGVSVRKNITVSDINAVILHFRFNPTNIEKQYKTDRLHGNEHILYYIVDMNDCSSIYDLDTQICELVSYLLEDKRVH